MPDFLTHVVFAREALEGLEEKKRRQVQERLELFQLGAQGPDVFFYGPRHPLGGKRSFFLTGKRLHSEHTRAFLEAGFSRVPSLSGDDRLDLWVYMLGMSCHYVLDSRCHPYVYAFSGYRFNLPGTDRRVSRRHIRFESILDVLVFWEKTGSDATRQKLWTYLPRRVPGAVDAFYRDVLADLYGIRHYGAGDLNRALRRMRGAYRAFYDPRGIRQTLWDALNRLFGGRLFVGRTFYPRRVRGDIDYLNRSHRAWAHPLTGEERNESFWDLYDQANVTILECFKKVEVTEPAWQKGDCFDDLDYSTGIPWNSPENRKRASGRGVLKEIE